MYGFCTWNMGEICLGKGLENVGRCNTKDRFTPHLNKTNKLAISFFDMEHCFRFVKSLGAQALAVMDTLDGQNGPEWKEYMELTIPPAKEICSPFCLPPSLLEQIGDYRLVQRTRENQVCHESNVATPAHPIIPFACLNSKAG